MIHQMIFAVAAASMIALPVKTFAASQKVVCNGNVSIFGDTGGTHLKELNPKAKGFMATDRELNFLRVGFEPGKPLVDIIPWGGITQHSYKDSSLSKKFSVKFKTDGSTWFSVSVTGHSSKNQQRIVCTVRQDGTSRKVIASDTTKAPKLDQARGVTNEKKRRTPAQSKKENLATKR